jgi:hypothetical protein
MSGVMIAMGPCLGCQRMFAFDPDRVPALAVDPETRLTPELGGDPGRAVREPVCPSCCKAANPERARRGFELLPEEDTAEEAYRDLGVWPR